MKKTKVFFITFHSRFETDVNEPAYRAHFRGNGGGSQAHSDGKQLFNIRSESSIAGFTRLRIGSG